MDEWKNRVWGAAVAVAAFVVGLHKLDDFDTWWHLAAGRWIVAHRAVPSTDTLSHTVRDHAWINLQWGFDVALYAVNQLGGPVLLCVAGAVVFALVALLLLRLVVPRLGAGLGALLMMLLILAAQERVTIRPELMSFLLLVCVLSVLDRARTAGGRGLWMLVPLMIVWANMHSLFVIGAFAIVCALVSDMRRLSRRQLLWSGAALASVLINPFGWHGALFPWTLVSRINGSVPVFQTIGEFASPFAPDATGISVLLYKIVLALAALSAAAALLISLRKRDVDWGGLLFVAGLVAVSWSARRNIALFAIGSAPFIARWLETVIASRPALRAFTARRSAWIGGVAGLAAVSVSVAVVTGALYKFDNSPQEFGVGIIEGAFPARAVAFARSAALPGTLYNDMSSGGYLSWDDPTGSGVYVDGRLEVYDAPFLTEYVSVESSPVRWQADADQYGVQTAFVFHRFENGRTLAGRLSSDPLWSLVYFDEVAAIFVRKDGNDAALTRAAAIRNEWDALTDAWLDRPAVKWPYPAGRIEGTRSYARLAATIGQAAPAIRAYLKLVDLNISSSEEIERRLLLARYFASNGRLAESREQAQRILAIDPNNADALRWAQ